MSNFTNLATCELSSCKRSTLHLDKKYPRVINRLAQSNLPFLFMAMYPPIYEIK